MKFSTKRIIAIVLAAVLVFSISVAVGSFSAAEDKSQPVAASAPEAKAAANAAADSGEVIPVTVVGNVKNIVKTSFETDIHKSSRRNLNKGYSKEAQAHHTVLVQGCGLPQGQRTEA